jgi:hypothetical protein
MITITIDDEDDDDEDASETGTLRSMRDDGLTLLERLDRRANEETQWPDEVDVRPFELARDIFRGWRGLRSFRDTPWDPLENLPPEYARVYQFAAFSRLAALLRRDQFKQAGGGGPVCAAAAARAAGGARLVDDLLPPVGRRGRARRAAARRRAPGRAWRVRGGARPSRAAADRAHRLAARRRRVADRAEAGVDAVHCLWPAAPRAQGVGDALHGQAPPELRVDCAQRRAAGAARRLPLAARAAGLL